jgi:hypothetical protein
MDWVKAFAQMATRAMDLVCLAMYEDELPSTPYRCA